MTLSSPHPLPARSALSFRDFRLFQLGKVMTTLALQMQGVAVGWQIYALTDSALHLGYVGLVQFLPALLLAPITGHVADRVDRRRILLLGYGALALSSALLLVMTLGKPSVPGIYAVLALVGIARAFTNPAGSALMPNLVPLEHLPSAVAWGSSLFQLAVVAGPALGGLLYSVGDAARVYAIALVLEVVTLSFALALRAPKQQRAARAKGDIVAGLRFVLQQPIILGAISLDLFAVLFGGAVALLPAFAADILHAGPRGMGLLRSAPAVGALLVGLWLANRPLRRNAGRTMYVCVALFGLSTIAFGLSHDFTLSLVALAIGGGADMFSVFVRQSLIQLRTPDAMRGRVSAVNSVFVGASNELGEFESGLTAEWLGLSRAVVLGGVGTLLIVGLWSALFPALRDVDRLDQT